MKRLHWLSLIGALALIAAVGAACAGETKTVQVTRQVPVTVIVEKVVEVEAAPEAGFPPAGTYKWKYFIPWGATVWSVGPTVEFFGKRVKEATNGALEIEIFLQGEHPYAYTAMLEALEEGATEIALVLGVYSSGIEPMLGASELPLLLPPDPLKFMDVFDAMMPQWNEVLAKWDSVELASIFHPHTQVVANVPATSTTSLRGLKLRTYALEHNLFMEMLGATGISMSFPEVPTALATGVLDGALSGITSGYTAAWYDYIKTITLWNVMINSQITTVRKDALDSLDPVTREALFKVAQEFENFARPGYILADYVHWKAAIDEYGVTTVAPPAALRAELTQRAKAEIWDPWVKRTGPGAEELVARAVELAGQ